MCLHVDDVHKIPNFVNSAFWMDKWQMKSKLHPCCDIHTNFCCIQNSYHSVFTWQYEALHCDMETVFRYGDSVSNTIEENSGISLIQMC